MADLDKNNMKECMFYEERDNSMVKCELCPKNCLIPEDKKGICKTRLNIDGKLYSLTYGKPISISVDPIEKKPFYHFHPGEKILSIGTVGCNLQCKFCQNYGISQVDARDYYDEIDYVSPERIIEICKDKGLDLIAFTYTEPTIFYEYALDIAKLAKDEGIECVIVSNGFINEKPLKELCEYLSAANIDFKAFSSEFYKKICSAELEPVLESLKILKENNIHIEVTNLIIDGKNDSIEKIEKIAKWIKDNLGKDTPLHLSRAFPMYKMQDIKPTPAGTLREALAVCKKHLDNVYLGNV